MTGAFGTTGMAPRESEIKMSLVHASYQDGAWGRRRCMGSFVASAEWESCCISYTSGRPLKRKSTKGASPNLKSAATEAGSNGANVKFSVLG
jgi:hypothetical protein